jgi:hypothetical protein
MLSKSVTEINGGWFTLHGTGGSGIKVDLFERSDSSREAIPNNEKYGFL